MRDRARKALLTGAAGCLGSAIRAVGADEFMFVCLDVDPRNDPHVHPGSFTDGDLIDRLLPGCDVVFHTASLHGGHSESHTPTQFTETNVAGMVTLLEGCVRHGVKRVVFSSSMEVLIGRDWAASGMSVVDERTSPNPDWVYPLNKLLCEHLGAFYHYRRGLEFVALRYMAFGTLYPVPGPTYLARWLAPEDVARANLLAATVPYLGYEIINIGPETPLTQQDIEQALRDPYAVLERYWPGATPILQKHKVEVRTKEFWPVTRIDRARRLLGWQPQETFEKYLQGLGWRTVTGRDSE